MNIQDLIQKIVSAAQRARKMYPKVTEDLLKFELINFQTETFWQSSAISSRNGYYAMQGDAPIFFASSSWTTYKLPITTAIPTLCTYTGLIIGNILFAIHRNDGSIEYVSVSSAETVSFRLPANTEALEVSVYLSGMITAKVEVERRKYTDITPYVQNWPVVEMKQSRDKFSGVMVEVSTPIEVTGYVRDIFKTMVEEQGLYARAGFNIYKRNNRGNEYKLIRSFEVDFQTYKEFDDHVEFGSIKSDLQEIVKSGLNTKYDFYVSSLTDAKKWDYERMVLLNSIKYTMGTDTIVPNPNPIGGTMYLPISYLNAELVQNYRNATLDFKSQPFVHFDSQFNEYFFKTGVDLSCTLSMKFKIKLDIWESPSSNHTFQIIVSAYNGHQVVDLWKYPDPAIDLILGVNNIEIEVDVSIDIALKTNDIIYLHTSGGTNRIINNIQYTEFEYFNLQWTDRGDKINRVDLIKPEKLLQKFLDNISGIPNRFTAQIDWNESFSPMLCAAESIRNYPNAMIHGSLKDFREWMSALGYESAYQGDILIYKRRKEFFKPDVTALSLSDREVSTMRIEANEDVCYTSVEVGYKKEDYGESANGRLEVNTQFDYATGYKSMNENVKSIISPYRSDSIGAELLFGKRGEKITDNSSDNDIFALQMQENASNYTYSIENAITVQDGITLYNGSLNPRFLALRNQSVLGIITDKLKFTATDGYRSGTIGGQNIIYSDIDITEKLFEPFNYILSVGSHLDMPDDDVQDGIIHFNYKGRLRKGYIYELQKACREKPVEFVLYMVK